MIAPCHDEQRTNFAARSLRRVEGALAQPHAGARRSRDRRRDAGATSPWVFLAAGLLALWSALPASAAEYQRGAVVRVAQVYLSPDSSSAKLAELDRGREIIVLGTSREWVHVEANLTDERTGTGWVRDQGVVRSS